jgi:hypothetical protein
MKMKTIFGDLAIGQVFEFRGRRYKKLAGSLAEDEKGNGCIFMYGMEVESIQTTEQGEREH